jgi:sigma-B regulation protein RsbQ
MSLATRHRVTVAGDGPATLVFVHGFGCDQGMWRFLAPHYAARYRTVAYDLMGSGNSELACYDRARYGSLQGHADDLVAIAREFGRGPCVVVGHSVSAMIGLLAGIAAPETFAAHAMIGPSPCYIDDPESGYVGGFSRGDIESLLETLEGNYLGWSSTMAPVIMGAPGQPELAAELTNSFCRTDPEIAAHFARVTFLSDNRADVPKLRAPALVIQCNDDVIAPVAVGEYLARALPNGRLAVIDNVGHCPHLSCPCTCVDEIDRFLATLPLDRGD